MIYLLPGLFFLWLSSELFVTSGTKLAKELKVPSYIIGLLIMSFGTSLPELILSIYGALTNHTSMVLGNIVGSNIANIAVGLGLLFFLYRFFNNSNNNIFTNLDSIKIDQYFLLISTLLLLIGSYIGLYNTILALISLLIMAYFIKLQINISNDFKNRNSDSNTVNYTIIRKELLIIIISSFLIYIGSKWTIEGGAAMALYFQLPELIIGLITIALGTSLPEIAVVISACRKNEIDLALGNIIGSNIYNVCLILSLTSLIKNITIELNILSATMIYLMLLTILVNFGLKYIFNKLAGLLLILSYIIFIIYSFS